MKYYILFLIFYISGLNAQNEKLRNNFRNQGEAEEYWAQQLFEEKYAPQVYEKFKDSIFAINESTLKFGNKTLVVLTKNAECFEIFSRGIFYPQLIIGNEENRASKTQAELESLSSEERIFYLMGKNDSLRISSFEELKSLSKSPKVKRFRFWVNHPGVANPQVYFIELTNKKGKKKMETKQFIKDAKLTFLKEGWLIL